MNFIGVDMIIDSERAKRVRAAVAAGKKPLVSFSIPTYNQEKYVEEAIKSAFAQTYQPLEINISDDCSKDGTWDIIRKLVAEYKGPHTVHINRNEVNLGVTANIVKLSAMSNGDFRTGCAGDDIAFPNKVEVMVGRWAKDDYRPIVVFTNGYWMSEDGVRLEKIFSRPAGVQTRKQFMRHPATTMPGATAGSSADVRDVFGPLNPIHSSSEDNAGAIRGVLLDHLVYLDEPTMLWRRSGLWSGMVGKPEYNKKIYYDGMIKAEAIARQALVDALQIKDDEAIRAMTRWWNECCYRKQVFEHSLWKLPYYFLSAWSAGARFWKLLRWTYHAVKYRIKFLFVDGVLRRRKYVEMGDREIIYEERVGADKTT